LDVGHRVRKGTPVQGVTAGSDPTPDVGEQRPRRLALAALLQLDAPADLEHDLIR
jgi:hypothetical protein